jgi:uncharacterized membrane protein
VFNGPVTVTLYASTDQAVSTADAALTTLTLAHLKLAAGKSKTVKLAFGYPTSLPGGSYALIASAEATGTNTAAAEALAPSAVLVTPATVDLSTAFNSTAAIGVRPGRGSTAVITITNLGNVTASGTFSLSLFAAQGMTLDSADVLLTSLSGRKINLKAGKSLTLKVRFIAPLGAAPGAYDLVASTTPSTTPADDDPSNDLAAILTV